MSNLRWWDNEPAVFRGAVTTLLSILIAVLNHNVSTNTALGDAICAVLPLLGGVWTRQAVTPVAKLDASPKAPD